MFVPQSQKGPANLLSLATGFVVDPRQNTEQIASDIVRGSWFHIVDWLIKEELSTEQIWGRSSTFAKSLTQKSNR